MSRPEANFAIFSEITVTFQTPNETPDARVDEMYQKYEEEFQAFENLVKDRADELAYKIQREMHVGVIARLESDA